MDAPSCHTGSICRVTAALLHEYPVGVGRFGPHFS